MLTHDESQIYSNKMHYNSNKTAPLIGM